jgi:hypothetical protein
MHPLFASRTATAVYFLAWLPIVGLLALLLGVVGGLRTWQAIAVSASLCLYYSFACLSSWYLCRTLPIMPGKISKVLRNQLAAATGLALSWEVLAKGLGILFSRLDAGLDAVLSRSLPLIFAVGFLLYLLAVALNYVLLSFQSSQEAAAQAQRALVLAREAELKALKSQLNPHFLFNCLNSISALTSIDPQRARDMCIRLSDFLRSTLNLGDKESITFSDELSLTRTYLSVEQVRFGARLRVEEHVDPACARCLVPPLLMQPLVENAIKHGVAGLVEGGLIQLEASCDDGRLNLKVANEFDPDAPAGRKSGVGLANVRNRLRTRYDNAARLDATTKENRFLVEMSLPCQE